MRRKRKQTSQEIIMRARQIEDSPDGYLYLLSAVIGNLERGDDATLERAAREAGDEDLAEAIRNAVRQCSQNILVAKSPRDNGDDGNFSLFAVPLVILNRSKLALPLSIPTTQLSKTIKKHRLIPKNSALYLYGALATLGDLALPPSGRYALLKRVAGNFSEPPFSPTRVTEDDPLCLHLRFLLGAVHSDLDDLWPFVPREDEDERDYDARLEGWQDEAEGLLEAALPGVWVSTPGPRALAEALEEGVTALGLEALGLTASQTAHDVAVLSLHGDDEPSVLRVAFFEGRRFIEAYDWGLQPHQDPLETMELMYSVFAALSGDLLIIRELHPLDAYPDYTGLLGSPSGGRILN